MAFQNNHVCNSFEFLSKLAPEYPKEEPFSGPPKQPYFISLWSLKAPKKGPTIFQAHEKAAKALC
jgi:hypothetical protein